VIPSASAPFGCTPLNALVPGASLVPWGCFPQGKKQLRTGPGQPTASRCAALCGMWRSEAVGRARGGARHVRSKTCGKPRTRPGNAETDKCACVPSGRKGGIPAPGATRLGFRVPHLMPPTADLSRPHGRSKLQMFVRAILRGDEIGGNRRIWEVAVRRPQRHHSQLGFLSWTAEELMRRLQSWPPSCVK